MTLKDFLTFLFAEMAKRNVAFAVLRNYESLPNTNESNDIDILIQESSLPYIDEIISEAFDVRIAYLSTRAYVVNYYLRNIIDGEKFCLQLDFVFGFERVGVRYMDTGALLSRAEIFNGFRVLSRFDQALVLYLSKLIMHGGLKSEYRDLIRDVASENSKGFIGEIERHAGFRISESDFALSLMPQEAGVSRSIQQKIIFVGLARQPTIVLHRYLRHLVRELKIMTSISSRSCIYIPNPEILQRSKHLLKGSATVIGVLDCRERTKTLLSLFKPVRAFTLYLVIGDRQLKSFPLCRAAIHSTAELVDYLKASGKG